MSERLFYGILEGFPRIRKMFGKLADYIVLMRPFTLLAPITVGVFLTLAVDGISYSSLTKGVYVGITLALAQAVGQIVNQVADAELDKIAKPYRPIPQGRVSKEEALGLSYLLAIAAVGRAFTISIYFGLMVCVMLFFAVFYSLPPISPRRVNPFLNLLWVAFSRGFIPIIAVMGLEHYKYAIISFIWCLGWQGTKDIPDVEADRKFGIKTIANTYGVKALKYLSALMTVALIVTIHYLKMYVFTPLIIIALWGLLRYEDKWIGENTIAWQVFYIGLALIPLMILINSIF